MAKATVRAGRQFGRLEILGEAEPYIWRGRISHRQWLCLCECGQESVVRDDRLKAGASRSCGCLRRDTAHDRLFRHGGKVGGRPTPEYEAWQALLHEREGGAAPVARRWRAGRGGQGFAAFLADVGPRPGPGYRLVRLDPRRAYGPGNCRWARDVPRAGVPRRFIRYRGRQVTLREAAAASGIGYEALCKRLSRGWPPETALRP